MLIAALTILAKELRTEFRTRELLTTTIVFSLMVVVLFSFTFEPTAAESQRIAGGLLWIAFLFAGSLMLHPSFMREQTNETLAALRLAPIEPFAISSANSSQTFSFFFLPSFFSFPSSPSSTTSRSSRSPRASSRFSSSSSLARSDSFPPAPFSPPFPPTPA